MKYFSVTFGLRGCYMPDSSAVVKVSSRRELKSVLADECNHSADCGYHFNRADVARVAAALWRECHKKRPTPYDFVIPMGRERRGERPFAVAGAVANRADWLEYESSVE